MEKTGAEGGRQNQAGIAASGNVDDDADRQRQRDRFQPAAESSSSSEKTTITAPAVKTERADSIDTVDMTQLMSEQLISSNKNIAGNFNLEGRTFTAEELAEIG